MGQPQLGLAAQVQSALGPHAVYEATSTFTQLPKPWVLEAGKQPVKGIKCVSNQRTNRSVNHSVKPSNHAHACGCVLQTAHHHETGSCSSPNTAISTGQPPAPPCAPTCRTCRCHVTRLARADTSPSSTHRAR